MVSIGFLAQASVCRLGESNRGSPKFSARVVAQLTSLHFERGIVLLKQGGLAQPTKRPNNKGHAKKDPIGLHSRWSKPTWASHTLHMGQRRCEDLKRCIKE
ncbi:hypothetical protein DEO72_LG8g1384 [Vigna unguiculata]|uniref:Uncharacterized protein n=1 Tax=Vigna unguiculata TaxID=3917 RepID=A0A4D6MPA6_VIGUN|nr:hypothetical protein DEO72_LG8g1384 [Vigna unguiculata]